MYIKVIYKIRLKYYRSFIGGLNLDLEDDG